MRNMRRLSQLDMKRIANNRVIDTASLPSPNSVKLAKRYNANAVATRAANKA